MSGILFMVHGVVWDCVALVCNCISTAGVDVLTTRAFQFGQKKFRFDSPI